MARNYGIIVPGFWDNALLRRLPEDCTSLLAYILTCPASTAAGTFILKMSDMTDHLRWDEKRTRTALNELHRKPFALWDAETRVIHLPGWYAHNPISNHKVAIHIARLCMALPHCELKDKAITALRAQGRFLESINAEIGDWKWTGESRDQLQLLGPVAPQTKTVASAAPAQEKATKGTRLTQDWQPDAEMVEYALGKHLNHADVERETTKFVRYWTGPDASNPVKKDWARTWANWIDKAAERLPQRANGTNGANGHANGAEFEIRVVDGYKVSGRLAFKEVGGNSFEAVWLDRAKGWLNKKFWLASWGPEPGQPRCKCPAELLTPLVD